MRLPMAIIVFAFLAIALAMFAYQVNRGNYGVGSPREDVAMVASIICTLITAGLVGALIHEQLFC